jgi:hypothetical protein
MNSHWRSLLKAICLSGFFAGTVDIGSACVIYKANPLVILQAIAGGLLGKSSFDKGLWAATLGLMLQWVMSIVIAACCVLASARIAPLRRHWITAGLIYGIITFFVMNYIVVPLSAVGKSHAFSIRWFVENMLAMLLFGLIIVFVSNRSLSNRGPNDPKAGGD